MNENEFEELKQCLNTLRKYNEISGMNHVVDGLEKIITNKKQCVYCGKTFLVTRKGQKYCPECVQAKISEKLRRENMTEQCRLRQKIYSRLYVRDGSGNNWDYGYDIYDGDSFTKVASEYKRNHTKVEYLEWLREIEKLTKRDSLSIEKLASDYKRNHTKDEYLEWLREIEKITK